MGIDYVLCASKSTSILKEGEKEGICIQAGKHYIDTDNIELLVKFMMFLFYEKNKFSDIFFMDEEFKHDSSFRLMYKELALDDPEIERYNDQFNEFIDFIIEKRKIARGNK